MTADMGQALDERRELIEARAATILDTALADNEKWTEELGTEPGEQRAAAAWWAAGRTVAAYRDRYKISGPNPLGPDPDNDAQKIDIARAAAALTRARQLATAPHIQQPESTRRALQQRTSRRL
jgi:hypothetical protein